MKRIKAQELKEVLMADMESARADVLDVSGDVISDRVTDISRNVIKPDTVVGKDKVWVGVYGDSFDEAVKEEKFGTRPFANTMNWVRTREPFVAALKTKIPWVK